MASITSNNCPDDKNEDKRAWLKSEIRHEQAFRQVLKQEWKASQNRETQHRSEIEELKVKRQSEPNFSNMYLTYALPLLMRIVAPAYSQGKTAEEVNEEFKARGADDFDTRTIQSYLSKGTAKRGLIPYDGIYQNIYGTGRYRMIR
jgi:hypothetical protein